MELAEERNVVEQVSARAASSVCLFPMISIVNSIPVNPNMIMHMVNNWDDVSKGGHGAFDERLQSAMFDSSSFGSPQR